MAIVQRIFVFVLVFLFIFSPRLDFNVVIHTGLFSVALLAILVAVRRPHFPLPMRLVVVATLFLFLGVYHSLLATIYENNAGYFFSICISVVAGIVFGWLVASHLVNYGTNTCDLLDRLLAMCVLAAVVNSSVILIEYAMPEIKTIIEGCLLQVEDSNINYAEHPFSLRGLASAGGASLSVFNAISILFLIYLWVNKRVAIGFALLGAVVITCSNVFTGRTGLILSLAFTSVLLITILVQNFKSGFSGSVRAVGAAIFFLLILGCLANYDLDPAVAGWAFEWVDGLGSAKFESASSEELKTMFFFPDDPMHLIFGVGFFDGIGRIYPRSDSGYLKTILSLGVPLSILLYSTILYLFFQLNKVSSKYFWLVVTVSSVMLLVEVKEPFLYQNFSARAIFLLSGAAIFVLTKRGALTKGGSDAC